jgi:hypothetical protein
MTKTVLYTQKQVFSDQGGQWMAHMEHDLNESHNAKVVWIP